MARLRTRKHKVVLNRSAGGDFGITFMLVILGIFMFLPMYYVVIQSFKPLDELLVFPPTLFTVKRPTLANYLALPDLISGLSVPLSRYVFNSVFIAVCGTILGVIAAAMAAFVLSKTQIPFKKLRKACSLYSG